MGYSGAGGIPGGNWFIKKLEAIYLVTLSQQIKARSLFQNCEKPSFLILFDFYMFFLNPF